MTQHISILQSCHQLFRKRAQPILYTEDHNNLITRHVKAFVPVCASGSPREYPLSRSCFVRASFLTEERRLLAIRVYRRRDAQLNREPDLFEKRARERRFPRAGPVIGARYDGSAQCARLAGYTAPNRTSGPHLAPYPLSRFSRLLLLISSRLAAACLVL